MGARLMLRRRILPCLDVSGGRVVKGVEFVNLRDCGEPVDAALRYAEQGADEICWLNITAGDESWHGLLAQVEDAGTRIDVPLTVGGGVSDEPHVRDLLGAGADKVSINSAALDRPGLVAECAERHGSQCIVVAIDARRGPDGAWEAVASGGRRPTGRDAVA
ncbi:MAG: imidazole glycerol phosphate synthase subunit HisF, partial [Actinomycetota bacterium]